MMTEWKPGDRAMVEIDATSTQGTFYTLRGSDGYSVSAKSLNPLPPSVTPLAAQELLKLTLLLDQAENTPDCHRESLFDLRTRQKSAMRAYRASIAPPDPIKVAIKKLRAAYRDMADICFEGAIAAIEKERG